MATHEVYLTPEVKGLIGTESPERAAQEPVTVSELRRFVQAIMDPDPIYWDEEYARRTRYGGVVCPPLFPVHYFRTPVNAPDPLEAGFGRDPNFDGIGVERRGLPEIPIPLKRILNAGNETEFYQLAKPGERLTAQHRIADIFEREGRSGRMVFVVIETTIWNDKRELLLVSRQSTIRR